MTLTFTIILVSGLCILGGLFGYQVWAIRKGKVIHAEIDHEQENPLSHINTARTSYTIRQTLEHTWHVIVLYTTGILMWTIRLIEKQLRAIVYRTYDKLHGVKTSAEKARTISRQKRKLLQGIDIVKKEE